MYKIKLDLIYLQFGHSQKTKVGTRQSKNVEQTYIIRSKGKSSELGGSKESKIKMS